MIARGLTLSPITARLFVSATGNEGERDAEAQHDLADHERAVGVRRRARESVARGSGSPTVARTAESPKEPGHDRRPGVAADGCSEAGGEKADREHQRDHWSEGLADRRMRSVDGVGPGDAAQVRGGQQQHPDVHHPGEAERDHHIPFADPQQARPIVSPVPACSRAGRERGRVHIDRVRHHGRAEHARRQQHRSGALETRNEAVEHGEAVRRADEQSGEEADRDDREQADDHGLERPLAVPALQREKGHRDHTDNEAADEERQAEEQVERDRAADHLGEVGGGRDELGLPPERPGEPAWSVARPGARACCAP